MARITITQGGITTDVSRGELDQYLRNGWKVSQPEPEPAPEPEVVEEATAEKKPAKKK